MHEIVTLPNGARVVGHGAPRGATRVLFVGRNDFLADRALRERLVAGLAERGYDVLVYEAPYEMVRRRIDPHQRLQRLPLLPRRVLKVLALLAHPSCWWFYIPARRRRCLTIEFAARSLADAIAALPTPPTIVIGRSAGARVASLLADAAGVDGVICLGFPFRHPEGADEPARYRHLAHLRTPCLIIQGDEDEYGGRETADRYVLSPSVGLEFVAADHELRLSEPEATRLLARMVRFIQQATAGNTLVGVEASRYDPVS